MIKIKPKRTVLSFTPSGAAPMKVGDIITLAPALQKRLKAKTLTVIQTSTGNAKSIPVTKRGRPTTGKAMTNAQRQAKFKALKKAHGNG